MIDNTKFNKDVEQQEVLHTSLGSVSGNNYLKKLFGSIYQSNPQVYLNMVHYKPSKPFWKIINKEPDS